MNPYKVDPGKLPSGDRYDDVPFYGRYLLREDDFKPEKWYIDLKSPGHWEGVLNMCDKQVQIYEGQDGGEMFLHWEASLIGQTI